ncbi:alanine racemase [Thalassotalea crassostreae]|uniref:alanine racemase n=1 Tax=Thalassotalea crassostreae TaxID=1763536 RepID=UPI000837CEFE|nr:alanine racemase [Thalassotalea crassostreae]
MARPTKALISKSAIIHNFNVVQQFAPHSKNLAIVKANAYGHGSIVVANILNPLVNAFGVSCIEEALEIRNAGVDKPILLLEGVFSKDEIAVAADNDFWIMISNQLQSKWLVESRISKAINVWLKVDTGMHRLGLMNEEAIKVYAELNNSNNVNEGIVLATHFSSADEQDYQDTKIQIQKFKQVQSSLINHLNSDAKIQCSVANSAAIMAWPDSRLEWNRPGFMLYGNSPLLSESNYADKLKPAMTMQSEIISIRSIEKGESVGYNKVWTAERQSKIATVAIGYGDGYPQSAKSGTPTLVNGVIAPLAGKVSMDMITIDVTDISNVSVGATVILWGEGLSVNEVAKCSNTSGYEILARLPNRTPTVLVE